MTSQNDKAKTRRKLFPAWASAGLITMLFATVLYHNYEPPFPMRFPDVVVMGVEITCIASLGVIAASVLARVAFTNVPGED